MRSGMSSHDRVRRFRDSSDALRILGWLVLTAAGAGLTAVVVVHLQIHGFRKVSAGLFSPSEIPPLTPAEALIERLPVPLRALYERPASGPAPAIEFKTRLIDLGPLNAGDSRDAVFEFVNTGPGRL